MAQLQIYCQALSNSFSMLRGILPDLSSHLPNRRQVSADRVAKAHNYYPTFKTFLQSKNVRAVTQILHLVQRIYEMEWIDPAFRIQSQSKLISDAIALLIVRSNPGLLEGLGLLQTKTLLAVVGVGIQAISPGTILSICQFIFDIWRKSNSDFSSNSLLNGLAQISLSIFSHFVQTNVFPKDFADDCRFQLNTPPSVGLEYSKYKMRFVIDSAILNFCQQAHFDFINHFQNTMVCLKVSQQLNELNQVNGKFGWCCICRKPSQHYCSKTKMPICGKACKKRIIRIQKLVQKRYQPHPQYTNIQTIWNFLVNQLSSLRTSNQTKSAYFIVEILSQLVKKYYFIILSLEGFYIRPEDLVFFLCNQQQNLHRPVASIITSLMFSRNKINQIYFLIVKDLIDSDNSPFSIKLNLLLALQEQKQKGLQLVQSWTNFRGKMGLSALLQNLIEIATGKYDQPIYINSMTKANSLQLKLLATSVVNSLLKGVLKWSQTANHSDQRLSNAVCFTAHRIQIQQSFNKKWNKGYKMFVQRFEQCFQKKPSQREIAFFLKAWNFQKEVIGEFFGQDIQFNQEVLMEFFNMFLMIQGVSIDQAVRQCFKDFSPPKQSQQISRVIKKLGDYFVLKNPSTEIKSGQAGYYLMFAMFQLQTSLHNPNVQDKLTLPQFIKNVVGFNDGQNFSDQFLKQIYLSIQKQSLGYIDSGLVKKKAQEALHKTEKIRVSNFHRESLINCRKAEQMARVRFPLNQVVTVLDNRYNKGFLKDSWQTLFFFFVQPLVESEQQQQVQKIFETVETLLRLFYLEGLEETRLLTQFLIKMSGVIQERVLKDGGSFLSTSSMLSQQLTRMVFSKELENKHFKGLNTLLRVAISNGNSLAGDWHKMLQLIATIDDCFSNQHIPRRQVAQHNRIKIITSIDRVNLDKVYSSTVELKQSVLSQFIKALTVLSEEELNEVSSTSRLFSLQHIVQVVQYNLHKSNYQWDKIWESLRKYFSRAGCHPNSQVSLYVIDSLKQLVIKVLKCPNILGIDGLISPFSEIYNFNSKNNQIKELVISCLTTIVTSSANINYQTILGIVEKAVCQKSVIVQNRAFGLLDKLLLKLSTLQGQAIKLFQILSQMTTFQINMGLKSLLSLNTCLQYIVTQFKQKKQEYIERTVQVYRNIICKNDIEYLPEIINKLFDLLESIHQLPAQVLQLFYVIITILSQSNSQFTSLTIITLNKRMLGSLRCFRGSLLVVVGILERMIKEGLPIIQLQATVALRQLMLSQKQTFNQEQASTSIQVILGIIKFTDCSHVLQIRNSDPDFSKGTLEILQSKEANIQLLQVHIDNQALLAQASVNLNCISLLRELIQGTQFNTQIMSQLIFLCQELGNSLKTLNQSIAMRIFLWRNGILRSGENIASFLKQQESINRVLTQVLPGPSFKIFFQALVDRYLQQAQIYSTLCTKQKSRIVQLLLAQTKKIIFMIEKSLLDAVERLPLQDYRPAFLKVLKYSGPQLRKAIVKLAKRQLA